MTSAYDREPVAIGIVHLGIGAFHRAHQAVYTDRVLQSTGGDWGICGVSLRSPAVRDALAPRDNCYTVAVKSSETTELQTVGAVRQVLVAPEGPQAVIAAIAAGGTRVVTLTVTEKGYCLHPASGELDLDHPDIVHDLQSADAPRTAIGFIVAGLARRRQEDLPGLTILSCDNLSANGRKLRAAVLEFAGRIDPELVDWIDTACRFPSSMVDRIVPATTTADIEAAATALGYRDEALVVTEPFSQWVIEENFAGPVPPWDRFGAQYVASIDPFEQMKLRLLNASHSTMAYLGCLAGFRSVADVVEDPAFVALVSQLMAVEMAPTLQDLGDFDVVDYQDQLMARFANRGLEHLTAQIAIDGSQKIPQRLLPAIAGQLQAGESIEAAGLGLTAWIRYSAGVDEQNRSYTVDDPLAETCARLYRHCEGNWDAYLEGMLAIDSVFPQALAENQRLRTRLQGWMSELEQYGARETVHRHWGAGAKHTQLEETA